ncbi:protein phosphatase 2C domain-containing protein, partial [Neglectibacter timonensis]
MMVIIMKADCSTDIGPVRASNQDTCECGLFSPNSAWGIVCDGMGGANGGNVASAVAVEKIRDIIISEFNENMSKENLRAMMLNAVNRANDAVHQLSLEKEELFGMGTTVVLMIATKGLLHVVHVGDSRAY